LPEPVDSAEEQNDIRAVTMHWFTSRDGTRFLVQDPLECARSLAGAFPEPESQISSERFVEQVKKECPPPEQGSRADF